MAVTEGVKGTALLERAVLRYAHAPILRADGVRQRAIGYERASAMQSKLRVWMKSIPAPVPGENPHFDAKHMLEETKVKQVWNQ